MMDSFQKASQKTEAGGSSGLPSSGSVSRLAGSAHRWNELYADAVQRKTTQSRIDHFSIENNQTACTAHSGVLLGGQAVTRLPSGGGIVAAPFLLSLP
jgi:hypothetical protein